ncbi:MAG: hypothetical protein J6575_03680 [Bifidobacterium sp.]|nr:hypothetical protein [Bifidobacterium sp.]
MKPIYSGDVRKAGFRTITILFWSFYNVEDVDNLLDKRVVPTLEAHERGVVRKAARKYLESRRKGKE